MSHGVLSHRTQVLAGLDVKRLIARISQRRRLVRPSKNRLHLGCGRHNVAGFLNVDLEGGDEQVDLACGHLPWVDSSFEVVVAQHVIEHLEMTTELIPLLREVRRVSEPGAELWLSCPDMEGICRAYVQGDLARFVLDKVLRCGSGCFETSPPQNLLNYLFHQRGEHKNLFDFALLRWTLEQTGFTSCTRTSEKQFLERFPGFPPRNDDLQSLYVRAVAGGTWEKDAR